MPATPQTRSWWVEATTWIDYMPSSLNEDLFSLERLMQGNRDELRMTWLPTKQRIMPQIEIMPKFMRTFRGYLFSIGRRK